jgi:hypothetical protein
MVSWWIARGAIGPTAATDLDRGGDRGGQLP